MNGGMQPFLASLALAPGLAVGSFLGVVAARVPLRRSVVRPGSACMGCGAPIPRRDNVPLVSYVLLRGRCRHCGTRIPPRDPAIELVTALLLAGCVFAFGLTVTAAAAAIFCAALVVVTATDLELRIVPNRVVLPAAGGGVPVGAGAGPPAGGGRRGRGGGGRPLLLANG